MELSDSDLVTESIEDVYRAEHAKLERALVLFTGDREVARDAVGEAFAQALRAGNRLREPRAWVAKIIAAG